MTLGLIAHLRLITKLSSVEDMKAAMVELIEIQEKEEERKRKQRERTRRCREKQSGNRYGNGDSNVTVTVTPPPPSSPLLSPLDKESTKEINPPLYPPIAPLPQFVHSAEFSEFWAIYPRKAAKKDAQKAWMQAMRAKIPPDVILDGLRTYSFSDDPTYIQLPASWLRGQRWTDERQPTNVISAKPKSWLTERRENLDLLKSYAASPDTPEIGSELGAPDHQHFPTQPNGDQGISNCFGQPSLRLSREHAGQGTGPQGSHCETPVFAGFEYLQKASG